MMSQVHLSVFLRNGNSMTFGPQKLGPKDDAADVADALAKLETGYRMMRTWLVSQLPPAQAPKEVRAGYIQLNPARQEGLGVSLAESAKAAALRREAEASVALDSDTSGAYTRKPGRPIKDNPQA